MAISRILQVCCQCQNRICCTPQPSLLTCFAPPHPSPPPIDMILEEILDLFFIAKPNPYQSRTVSELFIRSGQAKPGKSCLLVPCNPNTTPFYDWVVSDQTSFPTLLAMQRGPCQQCRTKNKTCERMKELILSQMLSTRGIL